MSRGPHPDAAEVFAQALRLHSAGNHAEAESRYRALRKSAPDHPDVAYNLAILLGQTGRLGEAVALLRRLVRQHPNFAAALAVLGVFLKDSGQGAEAVAVLEQARRLRPDHAPTLINLGNAQAAADQPDEAMAAYRAALAVDPLLPLARIALAIQAVKSGRGDEARRVLRQHLALRPDDDDGWRRLGLAFAEDHHRREAAQGYARAAILAPDGEEIWHDIRRNLIPMVPDSAAEVEAAFAAYEQCLADLTARYADAAPDRLARAAASADSPESFLIAYSERDVTGLLSRQGDLMARLCQPPDTETVAKTATGRPAAPRPARRNGRIRVGIVSQFFRRRHPVWKGLIAGWVNGLDRKRFEVIGVHTVGDDSADAKMARSCFDRVLNAQSSVEQQARAIAAAAPDILIFPDGPLGPVGHRLSARRLAPVQCATWGHPVTTGLPTLDVFLSADAMEPADAQAHYRERLARVAGLGTSYSPDTDGVAPHDRAWFNEADGVTLFACIHSLYKYLPQHDGLFPQIAGEAGSGRFLFFEDPSPVVTRVFQARLAAAFAAHGMDWAERCRFLPRTTPAEFYRILGACDVYLDPPGFSGFNTAQEALSYDIPVVAVEGRFLRARLAAGILRRIGMDELVAPDLDAYAALAGSLARDRSRRADLSARIARSKKDAWRDADALLSLQDHLASLL
ncbi:tetratricopeptide repeat protein [Azospirillum sp.]|uniref:O-linked N-acetylglucosamine transferase, SPINDLY family protein n=1 Tax=Azospirillum sp. TaxID=34012 RepID=UPI0026131061|nr:tetratricopeptide repeat protein [Azospirillum sp.]